MAIGTAKRALLEMSIVMIAVIYFVATTLTYFSSAFVDDSYIFSRYAQNLAAGYGLVWTPGEPPVEGFTSVLWLLLIALASKLTDSSVVAVAFWLGVTLGVLGLFLSWQAARLSLPNELRTFSVAAPLVLAVSPLYARHAASGMETTLVMALVLLAAVLWTWDRFELSQRLLWLVAVSFLAFLARPDALLLCASGTLWITTSQKGRNSGLWTFTSRYALPLMAVLSAYAIAKLLYFGSVIPLPAYMKVRPLAIYEHANLVHFVIGGELSFLAAAGPLLLTAIIPVLLQPCSTSRLVWAIFATTTAFLGYLLFVLPVMSFDSRFHCPLLALLSVASAIGIARFADIVRTGENEVASIRSGVIVLLIVMIAEVGMLTGVKSSAMSSRPIDNEALGRTLGSIGGISVAGSESGAIPFFAGSRFLDLGGLNDAFIASNRFKPDIAERFRDYLVRVYGLPDVYIDPAAEYSYALMANQPEIAGKYEAPIKVLSCRIYVRRDALNESLLIQRLRQLPANCPGRQ